MTYKKYIFLIFLTTISLECFGMGFRASYFPIDLLTRNQVGSKIYLDLMDKEFIFCHRGQRFEFYQDYQCDSSLYFVPKLLVSNNAENKSYLTVDRLIDISQDSIFVSVDFIETDLSGKKVYSKCKIKKLGINKSDLQGVIVGPAMKKERLFFYGGGLLLVLVLTAMVITGG